MRSATHCVGQDDDSAGGNIQVRPSELGLVEWREVVHHLEAPTILPWMCRTCRGVDDHLDD